MFPLYRKRTSGICSSFFLKTKATAKFKRKPHFSALSGVEELITCAGDVDKALLQLRSCNLSKLSNLSISSHFDETYAPPADTEGSLSPEPTCQ